MVMEVVCSASDLAKIQGNILRGYHSARARYLFLAVTDAAAGRGFLRALIPDLEPASTTPQPKGTETKLAVNLSVTSDGLLALGVAPELVDELPNAYTQPMATRAETLLDDVGRSHPQGWERGLGDGSAHILVIVNQVVDATREIPAEEAAAIAGEQIAELQARVDEINALAGSHGVAIVHADSAEALQNRREHFGWADGLGQPSIGGLVDTAPFDPGGTPISPIRVEEENKKRKPGDEEVGPWRPIALGEFIHGFADEDELIVQGPTAALLRHGTFMVYRKLFQDVGAFRKQLQEDALAYTASQELDLSPESAYELMAAKVAGRWRDGIPIELAPDRGEVGYLGDRAFADPSNDFRYLEIGDGGEPDPTVPQGQRCPVGAHIRRANPRDALGWHGNGEMSERHRIIRRGMPYGELRTGPKDDYTSDGVERGLLFICFNADIERQFEVVQRIWFGDGNLFHLANEKDYMLGDHLPAGPAGPDGRSHDGRMTIQTEAGCPFATAAHDPCVWTKGSEYLLMPGIDALQDLADGVFGAADDRAEHGAIRRVTELAEEELAELYPNGSEPAGRDQHARHHGLVSARFTVVTDLPPDLRVGIFATPAHTYDAWIRFSSRKSGSGGSDDDRDAHGMSIKLVGIPGPKVLPDEAAAITQDFVLANSPAFFCRDADDYQKLAEAMAANKLLDFIVQRHPLKIRWREGINLVRAIGQKISSPLDTRYWSQTPSRLGAHVVKYSATPTSSASTSSAPKTGPEHLSTTMQHQLDAEPATFAFQVQLQTDPVAMPLDDPTVRWDEGDSPFVTVATIEIPVQEFRTETRNRLAEDLSFTPWHTLLEHVPLGSINQVRRVVYEAISSIRHERNGVPREEPTSMDDSA